MNINLLHLKSLSASARALKAHVEGNSDHTVSLLTSPKLDMVVHIRWGNSSPAMPNDAAINSTEIIRQSHRIRFASLMQENEINAIYYSRETPDSYPVVVRTLISSSEGRGIVICRNEKEFATYFGHWWSYWKEFDSEFGVHVLGGSIVRKFKKKYVHGEELEFPIRNAGNDYKYSLNSTKLPKLTAFISKVQGVFPMQMGRYDIGWDGETKEWCLIEANTAPSMTKNVNTLAVYGDFIIEQFS